MWMEGVIELSKKSGCTCLECRHALKLFDGNSVKAYEYLRMAHLAVVRRHPNGMRWTTEDFVEYVNLHVKGA